LAQRFGGEVISCDSVAVYRGFEIGTAKPTRQDRALVPHHLIDIVDPDELFTAGEYARRARAAIHEIVDRSRLPIVVGGTGLYLRALLEGLFPGPQRRDELRQRLHRRDEAKGPFYLHRVLSRLDPAAAQKIHQNDVPKLIRAIEICLEARAPMSRLWEAHGRDPLIGYHILRIGLNPARPDLYRRINQRATWMFEHGLVEETRTLLKRYSGSPHLMAFNALGYRQAVQVVRGEVTLEEALASAQQGHRNYAKRQMTWFRREPEVHWLEGFGDDPEIAGKAANLVFEYFHPNSA
jgi:tRNA dimethylallyltransferase